MRMTTRSHLGILAAAALPLIGGPASSQEADTQAMVADLERRYEEAVAAGDAATIASLYTEDALYSPLVGGILEGPEAIQGFYEESPVATIDVVPVRTETVAEDLLLILGTFAATQSEEAGGEAFEGEFVTLAQIGEDGLRIRSNTAFPMRHPPEVPGGESAEGAGGQTQGEPASGSQSLPAEDDQAAGEEGAGDQAAGDQAGGDQAAGEEATGDEAGGEEATGDEAAGEQGTGDQATGDEAAGEEAPSE